MRGGRAGARAPALRRVCAARQASEHRRQRAGHVCLGLVHQGWRSARRRCCRAARWRAGRRPPGRSRVTASYTLRTDTSGQTRQRAALCAAWTGMLVTRLCVRGAGGEEAAGGEVQERQEQVTSPPCPPCTSLALLTLHLSHMRSTLCSLLTNECADDWQGQATALPCSPCTLHMRSALCSLRTSVLTTCCGVQVVLRQAALLRGWVGGASGCLAALSVT